jgi:hypothetical protein
LKHDKKDSDTGSKNVQENKDKEYPFGKSLEEITAANYDHREKCGVITSPIKKEEKIKIN